MLQTGLIVAGIVAAFWWIDFLLGEKGNKVVEYYLIATPWVKLDDSPLRFAITSPARAFLRIFKRLFGASAFSARLCVLPGMLFVALLASGVLGPTSLIVTRDGHDRQLAECAWREMRDRRIRDVESRVFDKIQRGEMTALEARDVVHQLSETIPEEPPFDYRSPPPGFEDVKYGTRAPILYALPSPPWWSGYALPYLAFWVFGGLSWLSMKHLCEWMLRARMVWSQATRAAIAALALFLLMRIAVLVVDSVELIAMGDDLRPDTILGMRVSYYSIALCAAWCIPAGLLSVLIVLHSSMTIIELLRTVLALMLERLSQNRKNLIRTVGNLVGASWGVLALLTRYL